MQPFKLLPIPFLLFGLNAQAEELKLPGMIIDGISAEEIPYAMPTAPTSSSDIASLVKRLPGAAINSNGGFSSIAQYRGLFGARVNVKVDGVALHEAGPNSMDSPLTYLPASRTKEVSVYRGIAPVRTGIETIGGSISAESNHLDFGISNEAEVKGSATASYGSNGHTRNLGLTTAITNQHHRLQLSGSSDRGDDQDFRSGTIRPSELDRDNVALHYGYQNNGKEFGTDIEHLDIGHTGTAALPMDILFVRGETFSTQYKSQLGNGDNYTVRLNYQDIDHIMDNYSLRTNSSAAAYRQSQTDVEAGGLSFHYQHQAWLFGFDMDQANHNATIYNPNMSAFFIENYKDIERDRYSLFTEWKGNVTSGWDLETGIRYSLVQMDAGAASVFAGAPAGLQALSADFSNADRSKDEHLVDLFATFTHELTKETSVEVGFARKTRAPSYQERYLWAPLQSTGGLADGNNYVGDINLDPEVAYQFELGLDWHTNKASFSPRVFYHHINDYIQGVAGETTAMQNMVAAMMNPGQPIPLKFSNVDAKLYGIDANWSYALTSIWQLDGTVSYVRGQRRDTSDDLYRIAPLTARTMLSYIQPKWRIGIEAETYAKQNKVSEENFEEESSGYALFNISGQYNLSSNTLVTAGVDNVFDRDYINHLGGINRAAGNNDLNVGERLPGFGRSAYITVNVDF